MIAAAFAKVAQCHFHLRWDLGFAEFGSSRWFPDWMNFAIAVIAIAVTAIVGCPQLHGITNAYQPWLLSQPWETGAATQLQGSASSGTAVVVPESKK